MDAITSYENAILDALQALQCVRILLYMRPHTPVYVSSYSCICVLKLIDSIALLRECRPRRAAGIFLLLYCFTTTKNVSSYQYYCVYAAEAGQSRRDTRMLTYADGC
jgi:hypothetical protein